MATRGVPGQPAGVYDAWFLVVNVVVVLVVVVVTCRRYIYRGVVVAPEEDEAHRSRNPRWQVIGIGR